MHILILLAIVLVGAKEVILSAGVNGLNDNQLYDQYTAYNAYNDMHIITGSSVLVYSLSENGTLDVYQTNDPSWSAEEFQQSLKQYLGLKTLPCLYCDATIGACSDLNNRLEAMYLYQDDFIQSTIDTAELNGWDGYYVDFEPDSPINSTRLTEFVISWGEALQNASLSLNVWVGGATQYDTYSLYDADCVNLVTMDTFTNSYDNFINTAASLLTTAVDNISRLGFGLLTNYGSQFVNKSFGSPLDDNHDIVSITKWTSLIGVQPLSLWSSNIPPEWFEPLSFYVKN